MISKKKTAFLLCAFLLAVSLFTGCSKSESGVLTDLSGIDPAKLPVSTIQSSLIYDPDDLREAVGAADYVFAGKVVKVEGTEYRYVVPMEDENGNTVETGVPYTHYTVQVMENLKGALQTDEPIPLVKSGGIEQDQKYVCLYENDVLPEAGNIYMFRAYTQEDGSLLISGPASNIPISAKNSSGIVKSQEYQKYEDAVKHPIIPESVKNDPAPAVSIYDKKAKPAK